MSAGPNKSLWSVYGAAGDVQCTRGMSRLAHRPVTDGRGQRKSAASAWNRLYHDAIIALVTAFPSRAPEGLAHLAAEIADAAAAERQRRPGGAL